MIMPQRQLAAMTTSNNNDDNDQLVEAMERLLSAESNRRMMASSFSACRNGSPAAAAAAAHNQTASEGPLMADELDILSLCCTKIASSGTTGNGFGAVDGDLLTTLTELLEKHVNLAVNVDLVQESLQYIRSSQDGKLDQWLRQGAVGQKRVAALRLGLEAASILLFIVASPGVELRVVSEDAMEATFTLLRHHLSKNIIPALNNTGHLLAIQAQEEKQGITSPRSNSKQRKRKSSSSSETAVMRELKKIYKAILQMMPFHFVLMERIEKAIQRLYLDDQQILAVTSGVMSALEIEAAPSLQNSANRLQHATVSLVAAVFAKFPMHRSSMIEDLFPLLLKLPTSKKFMRAYDVRYTSCLSPDSTKKMTIDLFGKMLPNGIPPHHIQMVSAMILSFVQCCVARPAMVSGESNGNETENGDDDAPSTPTTNNTNQLASGLRPCQQVADEFVSQLLARCSRKGEDGGASEFRPILANLVEDLLLVFMIPEYHAAQTILLSLTHGLSRDVIIASQVSNNNSNSETLVESTYVNTAFDTLGRIGAAYAKLLALQRSKELHTTVIMSSEEENELRCYCKRNDYTKCLMIDCDNCHTWYHAQCVGIHRDTLPNRWLCDGCVFQNLLEQEKETSGHNNKSRGIVDNVFIISRELEKHLAAAYPLALRYHMAQWVEELHKQSKSKEGTRNLTGYHNAIAQILERWDQRNAPSDNDRFEFTQEGGARALLSLTTWYSTFVKSFNAIMGLLVKLMADKAHASLRKQSLKAIEKIVDADPKLMLLPKVMNAVSERLSDESISVREAVVSLVGSYVVSSPVLANAFHAHLIPLLLDPGVSVRKRTVKILQDILCSNPNYRGRSDACDKCLQRAADTKEDDGVREALHALFMKLWLEEGDLYIASLSPLRNGLAGSPSTSPPGSAGDKSVASGIVTLTPTPTNGRRATRSLNKGPGKVRSDLAAEQMVAAVKIAGTNKNLASFMRDLLCNVNDSDKGKKAAERVKRQKLAKKQCFHLVDALFELLLSTEEKRSILGPALGAELVATVRTIGVFAEVSTESILKHLQTILPYLKADNGLTPAEESSLVSAASDILYRVAPILDQAEVERLSNGSVGKDLVKITYKHGLGALYSSIRALCTLAHHKDAGEDNTFSKKLLSLAKTFYAYLVKKEIIEEFTDAPATNNVKRLLSGLGSICRHHEVEVDAETWNEEVETEDFELYEATELDLGKIPTACFRLFSIYLQKPQSEIKCSSLTALSGLFVQHPRLLLASAQSGLIEQLMSAESPLELQMEALRCWKDISLAEEKRIDSGEAKKKLDSKSLTTSKKVSGDQDGDSTLVGGVLTKQSHRLFEMTQEKHAGLRIASLELLGQLLRQGLVNPMQTVPYLLALQGDVEDVVVRKFALNLLIVEGERRPDMLRSRISAGIKQACRFQRQVYPHKETSALIKKSKGNKVEFETVLDDLFKHTIISSKKQREGLYRNLITMFEHVEPDEKSKAPTSAKKARARRRSSLGQPALEDEERDMSLLSFAAQVLAYLPYTSVGDPLFIQHYITGIVALQAPLLSDRLNTFLRPYGLASRDELDDNAKEDPLERAAKRSAPSRSKEAAPLNKSDFDWPGFIHLCKEASALALLLRLKIFIKQRYKLSEGQCLQYNPEDKTRGGFLHRNENVPPFDASILTVDENNMIHGDEDRLIWHYAGFRKFARMEAAADEDNDDDDDASVGGQPDAEDGETAMEDAEPVKSAKKRRFSSFGGSSTGRKRRSSSG